jgi:hypothetical protein
LPANQARCGGTRPESARSRPHPGHCFILAQCGGGLRHQCHLQTLYDADGSSTLITAGHNAGDAIMRWTPERPDPAAFCPYRAIFLRLTCIKSKRSIMRNRAVLACIATLLFSMARAQHDHTSSPAMVNNVTFDSIKSLVGDWHGTYQWQGLSANGKMDAKYYLTGNGSAVVEDLIQEGIIVMTSVYHLDGNDVRVTHYCAAGNQPRLKAEPFDHQNRSVNFQFVDITNLAKPDDPHVTAINLQFQDKNQLKIFFTFTRSGKESIEQLNLVR